MLKIKNIFFKFFFNNCKGKYYIIADVETTPLPSQHFGLNVQDKEEELLEKPWLEGTANTMKKDQRKNRMGNNKIWIQFSSTGNFHPEIISKSEYSKSFDTSSETVIIKEEIGDIKLKLEAKQAELKEKRNELKVAQNVKDPRTLAKQKIENTLQKLQDIIDSVDSEIDTIEGELRDARLRFFKMKFAWSDVNYDAWPIMAETQNEVNKLILI